MLTADQFDILPDPIIDMYEMYTQSVINDIARRLSKLDITDTAAWQMQRLIESGKVYENALDELSKLTGKSETELRNLFERAGVKAMRFDDSIYRAAGLNTLPLNLSLAMSRVLATGLQKTRGLMQNLTLSTATTGQQAFLSAADLAYMQVTSGAFDYISAITQAVKNVAADGLTAINYASGRKDQLDVAVRRAVLTGISQTTAQLQLTRADEMGQDLVATSAHAGARPTHAIWQGKVFSRSGSSRKYPNFIEVTGYGTPGGLAGVNCRHSFFPWFEGISESAYSQADLDRWANKTVTYNGEEISVYDATQKQRSIERKIRYWKRQASALEAAGLDHTAETAKVKEWQGEMRDFIRQMDAQNQGQGARWMRQREREQIGYFPKLTEKAAGIDFRSKEYQRIADLGDMRRFYESTDPGKDYAISRPVIYNQFAANHLLSDAVHRERITWLERNIEGLRRAITSPDFIEKQLRLRKDGYFSATHIVDLGEKELDKERFLVVAISLSKDQTNGYHQITTIYQKAWRDILKSDGTLRDKYRQIK